MKKVSNRSISCCHTHKHIFNDKKFEAFLLKSGMRQGYPLSPLFLRKSGEVVKS